MSQNIILGSGKVYAVEYTGTIPEDTVIQKPENILGLIQGGATVTYTPSFYECEDDLSLVQRKFMTTEEVVFKTGICTLDANVLAKLSSTGTVTEDAEKGIRTLKLGGIGKYNEKRYVIQFVHATDGITLTIVGSNQGGFELSFAKDKETVVDAEFKAVALDSEGTKIIYKEVIPTEAP